MLGDFRLNPDLGTLAAQLQNFQTLAGTSVHEWMEAREKKQRPTQAAQSTTPQATAAADRRLLPDQIDGDDALSKEEASATTAELQHLSASEAHSNKDPRDAIVALSACDFGADGCLLIKSLYDALGLHND